MARKPRQDNDNAKIEIPLASVEPIATDGHPVLQKTGKYVVIFKDDVHTSKVKSTLNQVAGIRDFASAADFSHSAFDAGSLAKAGSAYFPSLGLMLVDGDDDQIQSLTTASGSDESPIMVVEPEYLAYASGPTRSETLNYLRGYRDAVNHLYTQFAGDEDSETQAFANVLFQDSPQCTWGLQATRAHTSRYSGKGVKVAVLDTGIDLEHPDFQGRPITNNSFIAGEVVQDLNGHGTHCCGTSCGPKKPAASRRYGIAYGADLHVGKVLNNQGTGATGSIVAGIEWAVTNGCKVISMSLGVPIDQKLQQYEVPIQRALNNGSLVVCAAGNNANRPANPGFVGPPANADAAMAVGALDNNLAIAYFSARSSLVSGQGGKVDIAAPGVDVYSTWPMTTKYRVISGTSMATPHVAGIAALWAEATGLTGMALWTKITQNAKPLNISSADVGSGLVQAPQ